MLDFWESPLDYIAASCCGSIYLAEGLYSTGESVLNTFLSCLLYPISLIYIREEIRESKNITEDDVCQDICGICCKFGLFIIFFKIKFEWNNNLI